MEAIKNFLQQNIFEKLNDLFNQYIMPLIDMAIDNIKKLNPTVLSIILLFVALLVLIGFFRWLFKGFKSFLIVVIILGVIVALAIFAGGLTTEVAGNLVNLIL